MAQFRDANRLFDRGEYVQAVQKYRAAAQAKPVNVEYRQQYLLRRQEAFETVTHEAERARLAGNLTKAETLYQTALQIEPDSALAINGIKRISDTRRHGEQLVKIDEWIAAGELDPAERMVRVLLAEDPDNRRAQNSLERIHAARDSSKPKPGDGLEDRFRKPVTLEFRDVPVKVAFDVLSKASGINFIYDQDIRPDLKVSVFLRKTPLDDAIRMIGLSTQLETRVINGNSVLVFPNTPQKVGEYRQLNVRSFYLANADAKKVAEMLKAILKTETVMVDEKLNMLVMRDSPDAIRLAERLIALGDIGEPEVMLDVEVLEVKKSKLLDLGISLPAEIGLSVLPPSQTATALSIDALKGLNASSIYATVPNATVKLHDERSDARILANPKIRVKTKEKASVLIGDKVPVITSTSTSTGFVSETVNYVDVGLKLEVEPSVYAGDEVSIKINLEVSSLVREITTASGTLSYQIGTRNAQTVLRLKDGETQILAGLINKEDRKAANGLPFISRLPLLSHLFGSRKNDVQNTEIVLSITPHLIRGVRRAGMDDMEFESGTANHLRGTSVGTAKAASDVAGDEGQTDSGANDVSPAPASTAPAPAADAPRQGVLLDWSAPAEVEVGEQFTAVLNISALNAIAQLPLMLGFDPKVLQVVSIEEGKFMAQGGGHSSLTKEVNLSAGRISATAIRQGTAVSGQGSLLQITFKALAKADKTPIRVLSATPDPEQAGQAKLADTVIKIR
ncbi:cohesin domain-containing protein [Rhodanobacter thiooxydans]|nr:cohesin domain-containing protein [Rhodanobacter thiooxydans]MCW0203586.1 cohesin domain-containing protein [Rhodanobacter thiooxydans]